MTSPESAPETGARGDPPDSPRAPLYSIGKVLALAGGLFMGVSCLSALLNTNMIEAADAPLDRLQDAFEKDRLVGTLLTLASCFTGIAGLGLLGAGIAMQSEHPGSGITATAVCTVLLLSDLAVAAGLFYAGRWLGGIVAALICLLVLILLSLSAHAASILRRFPPPADRNVATEEFLQQHRSRRRH